MTEFTPGGGDDELTIPLDTHTEADPLSTWPSGYSVMRFSEDADWDGSGTAGIVITERLGDVCHQEYFLPGTRGTGYRDWDTDAEPAEWTTWRYSVSAAHTHESLSHFSAAGEASLITAYPASTFSWQYVEYDPPISDWNDTGHFGIVETFHAETPSGHYGHQELTDVEAGTTYKRYWAPGASDWTAWEAV